MKQKSGGVEMEQKSQGWIGMKKFLVVILVVVVLAVIEYVVSGITGVLFPIATSIVLIVLVAAVLVRKKLKATP